MSVKSEIKYLKLLSEKFPNKQAAVSEIVNLQAILNLPKGTEHFVSDIHGEYEHFIHIMNTASGVIKNKIEILYKDVLTKKEQTELANLIYYPEKKLKYTATSDEWYKINLLRLINVCVFVSSKYTRSKVRAVMPKNFGYIIDELLNCDSTDVNKEDYYNAIVSTIISLGEAEAFLIAIAGVIRTLSVDHLHIVGDIFDRGPRPDIVMDYLMDYRSIDIQWGNHDVLWMGAGLGNPACVTIAVSNCLKYENTEVLENGYGISLRALEHFASATYKNSEMTVNEKMFRAISVIRVKIEDELMKSHPEYLMTDMTHLDKIDFENKSWAGYAMRDCDLPTVDKNNPSKLSIEEKKVIDNLTKSFKESEKLKRHIKFLFSKGSLYLCYNSNLLFHGSIPLTETGNFKKVNISGQEYSGKSYFDYCDRTLRKAYETRDEKLLDFFWYMWCGIDSPFYGKDRMTFFERLFVEDKSASFEKKQYYFEFQDREDVIRRIFEEFSLDYENSHIINGHIPVKYKEGENPVKAGGKLIVIDGGMAKAYRRETGIAGYTLISNSHGMIITAHQPFKNVEDVIENNHEMVSSKYVVENVRKRTRVKDTDKGIVLMEYIEDLKLLLEAYNLNIIPEKNSRR